MEATMKRIIIVTVALLVSALGAQAAPGKAPHHPAHRQAASNSTCPASQLADQRIIADVIDRSPGMGSDMHRMAQRMRTHCIGPSAPTPPEIFFSE
jgi:hypothetical protein